MQSDKSSPNKYRALSASKRALAFSSSKEMAERFLDASPAGKSNYLDQSSVRGGDRSSLVVKIATGAPLVDLDSFEICPTHKNEPIIAQDSTTNVFGCNKCVFERKINKPVFLAYQAKQTKDRIDS